MNWTPAEKNVEIRRGDTFDLAFTWEQAAAGGGYAAVPLLSQGWRADFRAHDPDSDEEIVGTSSGTSPEITLADDGTVRLSAVATPAGRYRYEVRLYRAATGFRVTLLAGCLLVTDNLITVAGVDT